MFAYLDFDGFYLVFLINLIFLSGFTFIHNEFKKKYTKLGKIKPILHIWIISSITITILDSIPYLYSNIFEMPIINVVYSNIFFGLICVSVIFYELSKYEFPERTTKKRTLREFIKSFQKQSFKD